MDADKKSVHDFWNDASCGERQYLGGHAREDYLRHSETRYRLEPEILAFADFAHGQGKDVLEIGVGLGADHQKWAECGANLSGVDLTPRAIEHTGRRFAAFGLESKLQQADAENLPFADHQFDIVYSWGVLMCAPDTPRTLREVHRVLKPGGVAKIMLYQKHSLVTYMLWLRYGPLKGNLVLGLSEATEKYLESPGTKVYSMRECRDLFAAFASVDITSTLTHGDLLTSDAGQRHRGPLLSLARRVWPRRVIRKFLKEYGLFMMITARK